MEVIPWKLFHGLVIIFSSRHARSLVMRIFHCFIYWAREASPTLGCSNEISRDIYTRKMVPITGRASASFSSKLKLKHIGNE